MWWKGRGGEKIRENEKNKSRWMGEEMVRKIERKTGQLNMEQRQIRREEKVKPDLLGSAEKANEE